jgi:hypothetical protein
MMSARLIPRRIFLGANMNSVQKHHGHSVQSQFHSVRGTARKGDIKYDHKMMKVLGFSNLDVLPETITMDNWSPDPWTVVGVNGANLVTFSHMGLTVTKAQVIGGGVVLTYYMNLNVQTDGWTVVPPNTPPTNGQLRLDFSNAQGGLIWTENLSLEMSCGTNKPEWASNRIAVDIYDLIAGAHLSIPQQNFWPC